eukprot:IDg14958t1
MTLLIFNSNARWTYISAQMMLKLKPRVNLLEPRVLISGPKLEDDNDFVTIWIYSSITYVSSLRNTFPKCLHCQGAKPKATCNSDAAISPSRCSEYAVTKPSWWFHSCGMVASKPNAGAIEIAQNNGLPVHILSAKDYPSEGSGYSTAITNVLESYEPDLMVMAGWMHFYRIPEHFAGKVLNIHPSLIPAF